MAIFSPHPTPTRSARTFHGTLSQRWADTPILKDLHPDEDTLSPSPVVGLEARPLWRLEEVQHVITGKRREPYPLPTSDRAPPGC